MFRKKKMTNKTTHKTAYGDIDVIVNDKLKEETFFFAEKKLVNYILQLNVDYVDTKLVLVNLQTKLKEYDH